MKRYSYLVIILIVVIFMSGCGDKGETIEGISKLRTKKINGQTLRFKVNEEKPFTGKLLDRYPNGQQALEENFKNGKGNIKHLYWYDRG